MSALYHVYPVQIIPQRQPKRWGRFLPHGGEGKVSLRRINKNILIREVLFSLPETQHPNFLSYEKNWNESNYLLFSHVASWCGYTGNPALLTRNSQFGMDIGLGPEEPWWGLPGRALAPPQPPARGGSEEGGPADLGWLWLGEHPWVLPRSPAPRGQLTPNLPCPVAFHHGGSREMISFCCRFFLFLIRIKFLADD